MGSKWEAIYVGIPTQWRKASFSTEEGGMAMGREETATGEGNATATEHDR